MEFEAYLVSKKIDSSAFASAEPAVWSSWKSEFEQLHPNSFTSQKLYLINPVRRKYPLKEEVNIKPVAKDEPDTEAVVNTASTVAPKSPAPPAASITTSPAKPVVPRPVFKPKPKTT